MPELMQVIDVDIFQDTFADVSENAARHADIIWLRMRGEGKAVFDAAVAVKTAAPETRIVLSGRPDIALAAGLAGVHLNASDMPVSAVKNAFPTLTIGYSAHSIREASACGADYVTLSPVFPTEKPYATDPLGAMDVRMLSMPVFALGGIHPGNVHRLSGLGYAGVAGISFVDELEKVKRELDGWR